MNPDLYERCEKAFLDEIVRTVHIIVSKSGSLKEEEKKELVKNLAFGVAAHLSGSSYNGEVNDEEIYPKLGFYHGETSELLFSQSSSKLHSLVNESIEELKKR